MAHLVQPVLIALLVIVEVGVFHLRVALAGRGRRSGATALGAVNAVISVAALGQVLTNLDRPLNVVGYAVGVSIGVYLGCVADDRLRRGGLDRRARDAIGSPADHGVDHRVDQGGAGGEPVQPGGDDGAAEEERRRRQEQAGESGDPVGDAAVAGSGWCDGCDLPDCDLPDCDLPDCDLPDCGCGDCDFPLLRVRCRRHLAGEHLSRRRRRPPEPPLLVLVRAAALVHPLRQARRGAHLRGPLFHSARWPANLDVTVEALVGMIEHDLGAVEVLPEVHAEYAARHDAAHEAMIWTHPGMRNWYRNAAGRVVCALPWRIVDYWTMTRHVDWDEYAVEPAHYGRAHARG